MQTSLLVSEGGIGLSCALRLICRREVADFQTGYSGYKITGSMWESRFAETLFKLCQMLRSAERGDLPDITDAKLGIDPAHTCDSHTCIVHPSDIVAIILFVASVIIGFVRRRSAPTP